MGPRYAFSLGPLWGSHRDLSEEPQMKNSAAEFGGPWHKDNPRYHTNPEVRLNVVKPDTILGCPTDMTTGSGGDQVISWGLTVHEA